MTTTQVPQPLREALAHQLSLHLPSRGANLFQIRKLVHEARWGGHDVQILRKLRLKRQDALTITFVNAFGEFVVPVAEEEGEKVEGGMGKPQNERLFRIFWEEMQG